MGTPKWIDEKSTFGVGKNAIKYGEDMPANMSKDQLKELRASGQVGEILSAVAVSPDTVPASAHRELMDAYEGLQEQHSAVLSEVETLKAVPPVAGLTELVADNAYLLDVITAYAGAIESIVKTRPNKEVQKVLDTLKGEDSDNG